MKRIAYLTPFYFSENSCLGGGERYPLNCARGVVAASGGTCTVDVLSFDDKPHQQAIAPGVTLRLLPAVNKKHNWNILSWDLPAALAGTDLVHIHQPAMRASEFTLMIAKQQRIPVCVTDHGSTTSNAGVFIDRLDLADRIVCYSDFGASLLSSRTPKEVIKGGVDCGYFTPPAAPPVRDRFLYVGRIVPHKGVDLLIQALPPDLPLTVCGRPYHPEYFQLLCKLAKGKRVEFIQDADDAKIRTLYHRAWANVLPTVYQDCYGAVVLAPELMGLTLLEAMACGTPVLCSTTGAMPEFVRHGETGFVYQNLDDLTVKLRHLASHPAEVTRMGACARCDVASRFDLHVVGAKLWTVYQGMMTGVQEAAA